MGFSFNSEGDDGEGEMHDINVTPFIDVMLVLLIIFMIAAPLSTVDIKVDLPTSSAAPPQTQTEPPLTVSVRKDGTLALGDRDVVRADLGNALLAETNGNKDQRIFVRADKSLPYGELMEVMNLLRGAGYLKVALVGLEGVPGGASAE